ncbi:MAG: hypothetical protein FJX64_02650 [Alphaproteobacteria bacterium]|nr:hypothetical protein [Alphaproteobacteria bacterium]
MQVIRISSRASIIAAAVIAATSLGACANSNQFFPTSPAALENQFTRADARLAAATLVAALRSGSMSGRDWRNQQNGHFGTITPVRNFTSEAGLKCVEYRDTFTIGQQTAIAVNTACQGTDGIWSNLSAQGRWQRIG